MSFPQNGYFTDMPYYVTNFKIRGFNVEKEVKAGLRIDSGGCLFGHVPERNGGCICRKYEEHHQQRKKS